MSNFDDAVDKLWDATKATYGDSMIYRYASGSTASITGVVHMTVDEDGEEYETRILRRVIEIEKPDISKPTPGDTITVSAGKHAGDYSVIDLDAEDEFSYWVAVG